MYVCVCAKERQKERDTHHTHAHTHTHSFIHLYVSTQPPLTHTHTHTPTQQGDRWIRGGLHKRAGRHRGISIAGSRLCTSGSVNASRVPKGSSLVALDLVLSRPQQGRPFLTMNIVCIHWERTAFGCPAAASGAQNEGWVEREGCVWMKKYKDIRKEREDKRNLRLG